MYPQFEESEKVKEIKARIAKLSEQRDAVMRSAQMQEVSDSRYYTNGSKQLHQETLANLDNLILGGYEELAQARCDERAIRHAVEGS